MLREIENLKEHISLGILAFIIAFFLSSTPWCGVIFVFYAIGEIYKINPFLLIAIACAFFGIFMFIVSVLDQKYGNYPKNYKQEINHEER